jgi:hypothetical protein
MQREKGKRFEREVASQLRERFPWAIVRRGSQAERADMPDVFFQGPHAWADRLLGRLWFECQDSRTPTPFAKLDQAERDIRARCVHGYAIAVWHKTGARFSCATMRLGTLQEIMTGNEDAKGVNRHEYVTLTLDGLIEVIASAIELERAKEAA